MESYQRFAKHGRSHDRQRRTPKISTMRENMKVIRRADNWQTLAFKESKAIRIESININISFDDSILKQYAAMNIMYRSFPNFQLLQ